MRSLVGERPQPFAGRLELLVLGRAKHLVSARSHQFGCYLSHLFLVMQTLIIVFQSRRTHALLSSLRIVLIDYVACHVFLPEGKASANACSLWLADVHTNELPAAPEATLETYRRMYHSPKPSRELLKLLKCQYIRAAERGVESST